MGKYQDSKRFQHGRIETKKQQITMMCTIMHKAAEEDCLLSASENHKKIDMTTYVKHS